MGIDDEIRDLDKADKRAYFAAAEAGTLPPRIFEGKKLLAREAALAVVAMGPLAVDEGRAFWQYGGGVWTPGEQEVSRRITDSLLGDDYLPGHEQTIRKFLWPNLPVIAFEPHIGLVNFRGNTMLDVATGKTKPHSPDYLSTCQLAVSYRPLDECPAFDKFVGEVNHPDAVEYFWQLFGYLLVPGNPLQRALFVLGDGGNGKGVWFRTVERIVGRANSAHVSLSAMGATFSGSDLLGKLVDIVGDVDSAWIESTAFFKGLTGGDTMRAERKYGHAFDFKPWCVPVFSGNLVPPAADPSYGYERRWSVIELPNRFEPDQDPDLERRFEPELAAIAAKAIVAYAALKGADFPLPPSAQLTKQQHSEASNPVKRFLRETCRAPQAQEHETPKELVFDRYETWCADDNMRYPLGRNKFYRLVENEGHPSGRAGPHSGLPRFHFFTGVKVKAAEEEEE